MNRKPTRSVVAVSLESVLLSFAGLDVEALYTYAGNVYAADSAHVETWRYDSNSSGDYRNVVFRSVDEQRSFTCGDLAWRELLKSGVIRRVDVCPACHLDAAWHIGPSVASCDVAIDRGVDYLERQAEAGL